MTDTLGPDAVVGALIPPGDARYEAAASIYNLLYRSQPALVVRPVDARDVARALALARADGHDVAVKGGGHSIAGHAAMEGGLLIDLAELDGIEVDPDGRSVIVGGGVRAGALTAATLQGGRVVPLGDSPDVGVAGLTLGGGIGWLSRKFGLTVDSLDSAEVVLADGTIVTASDDDHSDLFWALATRLGPLPFVPPEAHGQLAVLISLAWCGEVDEGHRQVDRLRSLAPPIVDDVHVRPYTDMYTLFGDAAPATVTNSTATLLTDLDRFDDSAIASVLAAFEAPVDPDEPVLSAVELRVLGGAVARVEPDATAFGHRDRDLVCSVVAAGFEPSRADHHRAWVRALADELDHLAMGAYVNFVGDANKTPLGAAYPPRTLDRLARVKAHYDPENTFHHNLNVDLASM